MTANAISVSILTVALNPNLKRILRCVKSARIESADVEHVICINDDARFDNDKLYKELLEMPGVNVIKVHADSGVVEAKNRSAKFASGDFLLYLEEDEQLCDNWLDEVRPYLSCFDVIYGDSMAISSNGKVQENDVFLKPDWSPLRLQRNFYLSGFLMVRSSIVMGIGGLRAQFEGAEIHDLLLRLIYTEVRVKHIDVILSAKRQDLAADLSKPNPQMTSVKSGVAAVNDLLQARESKAICHPIDNSPEYFKIEYPHRVQSLSVIIPTAFKLDHRNQPYIIRAINSLKSQIKDGDELIVVSGGEFDGGALSIISSLLPARVTHVFDSEEFNFSRRVNLGCLASSTSNLLVLNDDVEFLTSNALDQMLGILGEPNVGLVGALLLFESGLVQHGGHAYQKNGADHAHYLSATLDKNFGDLLIDREVSGVTGAVMIQKKSTWQKVGGFSHHLPGNFNDVDYCLKITSMGLNVIQANSVLALHKQGATRVNDVLKWEVDFLRSRWWHMLISDSYTRPDEKSSLIDRFFNSKFKNSSVRKNPDGVPIS
jgi:GT2 family glycosyltransferase